jgi:glyoxylase-like metal-dependent hydrolase (beta-lactamase superfamily II)
MSKDITRLVVGPVATNCWIYPIDGKQAAVIDPGDEADAIIAALEKLNLSPKYILLTHGHFDHIAALAPLAAAYSAVAPIIAIHKADAEYLGPDAYAAHVLSIKAATGGASASAIDAFFPASNRNLPPAGQLLEEGDVIGPFTVLHLPGHTPGSVAYFDKEENILFSGDTLFAGGYGRTDLPGGSDAQLAASLERLLTMDGNIRVFPGHDEVTTIANEAR